MLRLWGTPLARPTLDIDLMGQMEGSEVSIDKAIREILSVRVPDDGITFDTASLRTETIRLDADYQGVRARFLAHVGNMRIPMQVDVGFGDAVVPGPVEIEFPILLDFPAPSLLAYPPETTVAEKFQAIVSLDMANSRMKDFYDIWSLASHRTFEGKILSQAIHATFQRRQTPLPTDVPTGLSERFSRNEGKQVQWRAFLRKSRIEAEVKDLVEVIRLSQEFLMPPTLAASKTMRFVARWQPGGPWQS